MQEEDSPLPNDSDKIKNIASEVLELSRNTLVINLRFMDKVISMLKPVVLEGFNNIAVDGESIGYDPLFLLSSYKKEKELPTRQYLHMVFHCIFQHFYVGTLVDQDIWNLACDIAVESAINELDLKIVLTSRQKLQKDAVEILKTKSKYLTAEMLYKHFMDTGFSKEEIWKMRQLFYVDDHSIWYKQGQRIAQSKISESGELVLKDINEGTENIISPNVIDIKKLLDEWKEISMQMQMNLDTFKKFQGNKAGSLLQNLNAVNREKYDYTSFLKKFAVLDEDMKINDDEFDYVFYSYGLQLYERMPLIEPLEYREVKKIKEFVIAIDTSGSTSGDLVQAFVQKTYNILKQENSFFTKINIHIVQCDAEIQECVKITCQEEFDYYLKHMKIHGLGGTDFRPVFSYVDQLIKNKEFQNLKGMIYFTDGYGVFPMKQPDYQVAVVYIDDEDNNPEVPAWAIKLLLHSNEIENEMF